MLAATVLEVPTGLFSDRVGRRHTLVLGAASTVAAVTCYAAARGYPLLLVGAVLEGLGRAFYSGNNQALLYESLVEQGRVGEYPRYSGRVGSMFQLAAATAALVGGVIAAWSFRAVMWLSVLPQVACLLIGTRFVEPRERHSQVGGRFAHLGRAAGQIRRNPDLRRLMLANAVSRGAGESNHQLSPAYIAALWPVWAVGLSRTLTHGVATLSFWFAGSVIHRVGPTATLLGSRAFNHAAVLTGVAFPSAVAPVLLASGSLTFGSASVAADALAQSHFSDAERATMASLGSLMGSLCYALFAVALGAVADRYGLRAALFSGLAAEVAVLPLYRLVRPGQDFGRSLAG